MLKQSNNSATVSMNPSAEPAVSEAALKIGTVMNWLWSLSQESKSNIFHISHSSKCPEPAPQLHVITGLLVTNIRLTCQMPKL